MNTRGFTLVEIMIVVSIIGLLAMLAMPSFLKSRRSAMATAIASEIRVFTHALEQHNLEYGGYPAHVPRPRRPTRPVL